MANLHEAYVNAAKAEIQTSPFDRLAYAVEELRSIECRANELANRLTGSIPTPAQSAGALKEIGGGGLIDSLERQTAALNSILSELRSHLQRIENRL